MGATISEGKLHQFVMLNGRHKGVRLVRVPVGYLLWMVNTNHSLVDWAKAELARRGTTIPTVELSGHAIDRASQKCLKRWHTTRRGEEGLNSWLLRMCAEALEQGTPDDAGRVYWMGMRFSFNVGVEWPVLMTIDRGGRGYERMGSNSERGSAEHDRQEDSSEVGAVGVQLGIEGDRRRGDSSSDAEDEMPF